MPNIWIGWWLRERSPKKNNNSLLHKAKINGKFLAHIVRRKISSCQPRRQPTQNKYNKPEPSWSEKANPREKNIEANASIGKATHIRHYLKCVEVKDITRKAAAVAVAEKKIKEKLRSDVDLCCFVSSIRSKVGRVEWGKRDALNEWVEWINANILSHIWENVLHCKWFYVRWIRLPIPCQSNFWSIFVLLHSVCKWLSQYGIVANSFQS